MGKISYLQLTARKAERTVCREIDKWKQIFILKILFLMPHFVPLTSLNGTYFIGKRAFNGE